MLGSDASAFWQEAVCSDVDPELFVPPSSTSASSYEIARRYCQQCRVQSQCLEFAVGVETITKRFAFGMYGGLTPNERAKLPRRRHR